MSKKVNTYMTQSAAEILQARYQSLKQQRASSSIEQLSVINESTNKRSIEHVVVNKTPLQGEIPDEVDALIDNKQFRNRYKRLIREGFMDELIYLAGYAVRLHAEGKFRVKTAKPSSMFAKMCSVARWEGTLIWAKRQLEIVRKATLVAQKLKITATKFIYKQIRKGVAVEHWADTALEIGRDKLKHFTWLCLHEKELDHAN